MNKQEVKSILKSYNISPKKRWGQNFLISKDVLDKIIDISDLFSSDILLEVGPGLGTLTEELIKNTHKVFAYEIDEALYSYLNNKFQDKENLEIYNKDILNVELPTYNKIVSNIPYSITGPLFEKLFFINKPPIGILIIEKNLADRIFYKNNYKNYSRITVSVNSFLDPVQQINISHDSFYPRPKIDLSLIKLLPKSDLSDFITHPKTRAFYLKFIAGIMPYKNKNIINAIILFLKNMEIRNIEKSDLRFLLNSMGYKNSKVYEFEISEYPNLCKEIYNYIQN
ncbi:MAG: ribosomal RNA small subunit methyltransferase A [Candidatus Lokiarchaeota archaeon]|nr:ribosomal RNA small subunit methyltransferase A [Candidatus Lokiarchaeota archaeon]MBD3200169.1 ribosomal RNA small subunit methyltransferase A [Candidatus Lokiarchaeota archaeon]